MYRLSFIPDAMLKATLVPNLPTKKYGAFIVVSPQHILGICAPLLYYLGEMVNLL